MARLLGALAIAGSLLGAVVLTLLPIPSTTHLGVTAAAVAGAATLGAALLMWADRLSWTLVQVALALGSLAVSVDIAASGAHTVGDQMLYLLPAGCAWVFSPRRLAMLQLGVIAGTYAAALAVAGEPQGATRWVVTVGILGVMCAAIDRLVTSRELAASETARRTTELQAAEARFRTAFDEAGTGMTLGYFDGRLERVNAAFARFVGYEQDELMRMSVGDFTHADDREASERALADLAAGRVDSFVTEKRYVRKDGEVVWGVFSATSVRDPAGVPLHYIAQIQDVTARRQAEAELAHRAVHDALTGLPNRELFVERLERALEGLASRPRLVTVFFLDLDRFKLVNDGFGHTAGDGVICEIGNRLRSLLGPDDLLARFGGDEFTLLSELATDADPAPLADRLVAALAEPVQVAGRPVFLSASVGVATTDRRGLGGDDLLARADAAMYRAKDAGGARWATYHYAMQARGAERMAVEAELHRALDHDEFEVFYQPVVDLETTAPVAVEALVRWRHPERGLLTPAHFVPAAEEAGLLVPLGTRVLQLACDQARAWHDSGHELRMAVNLSPRHLADPGLVPAVHAALEDSGLDAGALCLELSEDVVLEDVEASREVLLELKALGVMLSLDDFGVGSWSLSLVRRLAAIDELKIDRTWIAGLGRTAEDEAVVAAVVGVARALGLSTVAEGVETAEQAVMARRLGCTHAQGYLFARPCPAAELEPLLAASVRGALLA